MCPSSSHHHMALNFTILRLRLWVCSGKTEEVVVIDDDPDPLTRSAAFQPLILCPLCDGPSKGPVRSLHLAVKAHTRISLSLSLLCVCFVSLSCCVPSLALALGETKRAEQGGGSADHWACAQCTLHNLLAATVCSVCGTCCRSDTT